MEFYPTTAGSCDTQSCGPSEPFPVSALDYLRLNLGKGGEGGSYKNIQADYCVHILGWVHYLARLFFFPT